MGCGSSSAQSETATAHRPAGDPQAKQQQEPREVDESPGVSVRSARAGLQMSIVPTVRSPLGQRLLSEDSLEAPTPASVASTRKYSEATIGSPQGQSGEQEVAYASTALPSSSLSSPDEYNLRVASSGTMEGADRGPASPPLSSPPPPPEPFLTQDGARSIVVPHPQPSLDPRPLESKRDVMEAIVSCWPIPSLRTAASSSATPLSALLAQAKEEQQFVAVQQLFRDIDADHSRAGKLSIRDLYEGLVQRHRLGEVDSKLFTANLGVDAVSLVREAVFAVKEFWSDLANSNSPTLQISAAAVATVSAARRDLAGGSVVSVGEEEQQQPFVEARDLRLIFIYLRAWLAVFILVDQMNPSADHFIDREDFRRVLRFLREWGTLPTGVVGLPPATRVESKSTPTTSSEPRLETTDVEAPARSAELDSEEERRTYALLSRDAGVVRLPELARWACRLELASRYDPLDDTLVS